MYVAYPGYGGVINSYKITQLLSNKSYRRM